MSTQFQLIRFNPRRASRGEEAADVEVSDDILTYRLWMSPKDLRRNIAEFGDHPELRKALEHYRTRKEFPESEDHERND